MHGYIVYIIFVLLVVLFAILTALTREQFTYNDFYDKHYQDISVPTDFYEKTARIVDNHYLIEMHDQFFIDTLDKEKASFHKSKVFKPLNQNISNKNKTDIENRTGQYLLRLLNAQLSSNERFIFRSIYSKATSVQEYIWDKGLCFVCQSNHIVYRDTKIYGASISMQTLHDKMTGGIYLMDYRLNGFVFQDKVEGGLEASNLIDNNYQEYMKDNVKLENKAYEKQFLCQYYKDLKKYRGISITSQDCDTK